MLDQFILDHRDEIIADASSRVAARRSPHANENGLRHGIPVFLDQLGDAIRRARSTDVVDHSQIDRSATIHGHDLLHLELTVAQVVHAYGDVCQAITDLAVRLDAPVSSEDFKTLNLCLDDAIASAVTEYGRGRESVIEQQGTERLGTLAHELRNLLTTAILSFESIRTGRVAPGGSTGAVHARSLMGLRDLVDRSLADVRLDAGIVRRDRIAVADLLEEVEVDGMVQAQVRNISLAVTTVDPSVTIVGDRQTLAAALANLLQNAFKFTPRDGNVSLSTRVTDDRVFFDVADECGGLPAGRVSALFLPFAQRSTDRSGLGLGLSISRKAAKANGGDITVRDVPGKGCVFTLELPREVVARSVTAPAVA